MLPLPQVDTLSRGRPQYVCVMNPTDALTGADLTPSAVQVRVLSLDLTVEHADVPATFSQPVSDALTVKYGQPVRAWVATLPASDFGGAAAVVVERVATVLGVEHPHRERARVVGL
jgi:hypothetical protein